MAHPHQNPIPPVDPQDSQRGRRANADSDRPKLTDADVWLLVTEGCNVAEIAAYARVSKQAAETWIVRAGYMAAMSIAREARRLVGEARAQG